MPVSGRSPAKITVDFTNVEERRGRSDHVPPGDYVVHVVSCQMKEKKDDASRKYLNWLLMVDQPAEFKGKQFYFVTSLVQESLWNLRNFLVDMLGETRVPKRSVDIPIAKIVEAKKKVGVTVDDDEYEGKTKSKVVATFPPSEYSADGSKAEASDDDEETESTGGSNSDDEDLEELDVDDI